MTLELAQINGYIAIPSHPINLYFDFIPLTILGTALIYLSYRDFIKKLLGGETKDV